LNIFLIFSSTEGSFALCESIFLSRGVKTHSIQISKILIPGTAGKLINYIREILFVNT
jgi:hypothetical protein